MASNWWHQEVRFLQPKAQRTPYTPAPALIKYVAMPAAGFVGGIVLGHLLRSKFVHYMGRSLVRGMIYRELGALTGTRRR